MKKIIIVTGLVCQFFIFDNYANAETLVAYPSDDAVAQLYDDDGVSDWDMARGFAGELFRTPIAGDPALAVRSDNGVGTYRIYRVSKVFDLQTLPLGSVITSAKVKLYRTPYNNQGNTSVVIVDHWREDIATMQKGDWKIENFGSEEFARQALIVDEYTEFPFNADGLSYLNSKIGNKGVLGFLTDYDFDDMEPGGPIFAAGWYSVDNPGTEFDPYLEITYTVPEEEAEIDREAFVALVTEATSDEKRVTQRFFVASANQLFDLIEGDRDRLALLHLKVFKVLLKAKGIDDAELSAAIETLKGQLQE